MTELLHFAASGFVNIDMLQIKHIREIVASCYPQSAEEAIKLAHDIKPVKFGNSIQWIEVLSELASYQIPQNTSYLLIQRVECYTTTFIAAAPGFGNFSPPPNADAYWAYTDSTAAGDDRLSPTTPIHILCDVDEYLMGQADHRITLLSDLPAPPDGNARLIRTTVYAYLIGGDVADRIGDNVSTYAVQGLA